MLLVLADVLALVFGLEAAAARVDLAVETERAGDFFAVELFAAAVFVAPLVTARLACVLERAAEPLARAAAVEAVADDFFSAFLLEDIRGLLLCCPAVETGRSLPLTNHACRRQSSRDTAKAACGNLASAAYPAAGPLADSWGREAFEIETVLWRRIALRQGVHLVCDL
ncbi:MAG: hypothetical protein AB7U61_08290 [Methylocystis sp.]